MSGEWVDVCAENELSQGARKIIETDDVRVLVVNVAGQICAVESLCTHAMFELDDAEIEAGEVICPLHHAHFCLKTGKALCAPAYEDLPTFETRCQNGMIQVRVSP